MHQLPHGITRRGPPLIAYVLIFVGTGIVAAGGDDPILTLACGASLALSLALLWKLGEAPTLFMVAGLQLSQVILPRLYADLRSVPLDEVSPFHIGDLASATWFALAAITSLVIGMWRGERSRKTAGIGELAVQTTAWSPRAAFGFCLATVVIAVVFGTIGQLSPGLLQPALAAGQIQWLGVFVLVCVCTAKGRGYGYLLLVSGVAVIQGLIGFFGDFKDVFIVILIGLFAVKSKLRPGNILIGLVVATFLLILGAFWSATKMDYREFVSQGSRQQLVLVPVGERLAFLLNRVFEADGQTLSTGFERLARRWGYVDLLAASMRNVPAQIPFQDGAQIGSAIMHALEPRLFFPDKPPLPSDTDIAVRYSGVRFDRGNNAVSTSISLGYVAELYVDFGRLGTLAAMFIFGVIFGRSFKFVTSSESLPAVLNSGLGVMLMMSVMSFEEGLTKMVGGFLTTLVAVLVVRKFVLPYLMNFIRLPLATRLATPAAE